MHAVAQARLHRPASTGSACCKISIRCPLPGTQTQAVKHAGSPCGAGVIRARSVNELQARQLGVEAILCQQFGVGALGDDAAVVHHDDTVGLEHGR